MLTENTRGNEDYAVGTIKGQNAETGKIHELDTNEIYLTKDGNETAAPYPYGFDPTFHRYRLAELRKTTKPQTVFVCSMADMFGEWVPDGWITEIFRACDAASWHRYLFLTKNPQRCRYFAGHFRENTWLGITSTHFVDGIMPGARELLESKHQNLFVSMEPMLASMHLGVLEHYLKWVIVGAETGNRKGKIIPKREWIESIVEACKEANIPVFLKNSLAEIWQGPLIQEFPWKE